MNTPITLYHAPQSRSMRTLWLLHELGVPFETVVQPLDKSLRALDYLARSPAGRVPALAIDGAMMFESGAITEYLCERFPDPGLGRAPGTPERRDWLAWVHFSETLSQHTAALTQQHVFLYDDTMRSPTIMQLEAARARKCLGAVEARLADRGYLLDGGFSAADISVGHAVYMAQHFVSLEPFPTLGAWWARLGARPAFQASLPAPDEPRLYAQDFYPPLEGDA